MKFKVTEIKDKETGNTVKWKLDAKSGKWCWWPVWNDATGSRYYATYEEVKTRILGILWNNATSNTEHEEEWA